MKRRIRHIHATVTRHVRVGCGTIRDGDATSPRGEATVTRRVCEQDYRSVKERPPEGTQRCPRHFPTLKGLTAFAPFCDVSASEALTQLRTSIACHTTDFTMPTLLHEYWENDDGGEFTTVQERADEMRPNLMPGARFVFEVWAASWQEAMQLRNDRLGYGTYQPADGVPDHFYTAEESAVQVAYLERRNVR